MLTPDETARRVKAARILAGFPSADALGEELGQGLSGKTLRRIESGARTVRPHELREIARACGIPFGFFTVDLADLGSPASPETAVAVERAIAELLPRLEDSVTERVLARMGFKSEGTQ